MDVNKNHTCHFCGRRISEMDNHEKLVRIYIDGCGVINWICTECSCKIENFLDLLIRENIK